MSGYVLLEDGTRFDGDYVGADAHATGEVVFTTGMAGYQESVTDPSFAGQLITFAYPHIGNYGVNEDAMESTAIHARAAIMREAGNHTDAPLSEQGWLDWLTEHGIPAITGVDTRALVRHIRSAGAMRGGVFPARVEERQARELIDAELPMAGQDLARTVTPEQLTIVGDGGLRIAAIDTGIKSSIVRHLVERGATVELHPCDVPAQAVLDSDPDAVFMANGPGDPAALDYVVSTLREIVGKKPVWGICLGHQLLSRAVGLETFKLPFGHRGANHPVLHRKTGRVLVTSQNHGFAVAPTDEREATHVSLYDGTVEGFDFPELRARSVQFHPEAGPGPHDAWPILERWLDDVRLQEVTDAAA
mgnify:CR=1 FL=1